MTTKQEDFVIMLSNVRVAFPHFWTAQQVNGQGKAAYSGNFIMPPDHPDVARIREAITAAANAKWKEKAPAQLAALIAADKVCLHSGELKAQYEGFTGNLFLSARGYTPPLVIGQDPTAGPLLESGGKPYSGCFVNAQVAIWAQHNNYGPRVNAQLRGVQFLRDGPAFAGGAVSQADDFEQVDNSADDAPPAMTPGEWPEPTGGAAGGAASGLV